MGATAVTLYMRTEILQALSKPGIDAFEQFQVVGNYLLHGLQDPQGDKVDEANEGA